MTTISVRKPLPTGPWIIRESGKRVGTDHAEGGAS